ncbi:RNA polymerase-associated protein rtf1 [Chytriomyces hyalinus]|nr:RNA polymerase-associated protein rtf1 [Chytriomyces hyalinus]
MSDFDDDIEDELLALAAGEPKPRATQKKRRNDSDSDRSDDEDGAVDDEVAEDSDDNEEVREIRRWGDDLMGDEEDRRMLNAMTALDREKFLADRAERRQVVLDRLELKRKVRGAGGGAVSGSGASKDAGRRSNRKAEEKSKASKSLRALKRQRDEKSSKRTSSNTDPTPEPRKAANYYSSEDEDSDRDQRDRGRDRDGDRGRDRDRDRYSDDDDRYRSSSYRDKEYSKSSEKPGIDLIRKITVSRNDLERWMYMRNFRELVIGSFVRLVFGVDPETKQQKYRLCKVADVSERDKTYNVGSSVCKKQLHLVYGSFKEKAFLMDIVSNSPPSEDEYSRYLAALAKEPMISSREAEAKSEEIQEARNHVFSNEEVEEMVAQKKALLRTPINIASEKILVLRQLDQARDDENFEQIAALEAKLEELNELTSEKLKEGTSKLDAFAKLNERNRLRGYEEARRAEIEMKNFKSRGANGGGSMEDVKPVIQERVKPSTSIRIALNQLELTVFSKDPFFDTIDLSDLL